MFDLTAALFSLTTHELKYANACLAEVNLKGALTANVAEFFDKLKRSQNQPGGSLQAKVDAAAARIQGSDGELTVTLTTHLAEALGAQPVSLGSPQGCADLGRLMLAQVLASYRVSHPTASVGSADDFVREIVGELVTSLTPKTPDATTETLTAAREAAQAGDWANTKAALCATTVRLGLVPTDATPRLSLLALLASPGFLAGLTGGGSVLQFRKQDNAIRERYVPAYIGLLLLGGYDQAAVDGRAAQVATFWLQQLAEYGHHLSASNVVNTELSQQQTALDDARAARKQAETDARDQRAAIAAAAEAVETQIVRDEALVTGLAAGGPVQAVAQDLAALRSRLAAARAAEPANKGFGAKIMAGLKRGVAEAELAIALKRSQGQLAQAVVAAPAEALPPSVAGQAETAAGARVRAVEADTRAEAAGARASGLQETVKTLTRERDRLAGLMAALEDRFPGLGQSAGGGAAGQD